MSATLADRIREHVEEIQDFPKPGLRYRDITPIVQDSELFKDVIEEFASRFAGDGLDLICGIESRGFIFGGALAYRLGLGFIPIHWAGKLPPESAGTAFDLEYRFDALEVHRDAVAGGKRVLLVDDFFATGATMKACTELVRKAGGEVAAGAVVVEVESLGGREQLDGLDLVSLCRLTVNLDE